MKCIILFVVLVLLCNPVMATTLKTTFQDYVPFTSTLPTTEGDWVFAGSGTTDPSYANVNPADTYGHVDAYIHAAPGSKYGQIYNANPAVFAYAAWTNTDVSATFPGGELERIYLLDSTGGILWTTPYTPTVGRYELKIIGGIAYLYCNNVSVATSPFFPSNPYTIDLVADIGGGAYNEGINKDDMILGLISDSSIVGTLPSNYFIYYDSSSPAATGLYKSNYPAAPTLINSNYFGVSYGRTKNPSTNLLIKDPTGTLVKSYFIDNQSCECEIPIADLYVGGTIMNGLWTVELQDSPTTSQHFAVYADGASVSWSSSTYAQQDTATITYSITAGRWNPASYTYSLKIIDVYGNIINTQSITSQTGTLSYTWADTDALGVYYAEVFQTSIADPTSNVLLNYAATTLTGTFSFSGYVLDAEYATPLSGAGVNFTQLGTPRVSTSAADGSYSASGFVTGGSVIVNVTKSGYVQYYNTITPTRSRNIALNLSILSTNPTKVGATIGGIFRDLTYSSPIPGVTVSATNGSTLTATTNNAGYYSFANLVNGTCYRISGSKTGYAMPSSNPTGSLKCAGGIL